MINALKCISTTAHLSSIRPYIFTQVDVNRTGTSGSTANFVYRKCSAFSFGYIVSIFHDCQKRFEYELQIFRSKVSQHKRER